MFIWGDFAIGLRQFVSGNQQKISLAFTLITGSLNHKGRGMTKQNKYTRSARGQSCQVRVPGVCNHDPQTVVFAHLNGGGWGAKQYDIHGCYACDRCHFWLDGGYVQTHTRQDRDLTHLEAMVKTQQIMIKEGTLIL